MKKSYSVNISKAQSIRFSANEVDKRKVLTRSKLNTPSVAMRLTEAYNDTIKRLSEYL